VSDKGIVELDVAVSDEWEVDGNNEGGIEVAWKGSRVGSTTGLIIGVRMGNFEG